MKIPTNVLPARDPTASLSPEADAFLASACAEFNRKQAELDSAWRFDQYESWGFDQDDGLLQLKFKDGARIIANGQILGSHAKSDDSWEWAWNNPYVSDHVKADSLAVKRCGERLSIPYLVAATTPVPDPLFLSYLCAIGLKATDSMGVFRGSAGAIDIFILLKNIRWHE